MSQEMNNKEFFIEYMNALNGKEKRVEVIGKYVSDEALIEHIIFFDAVFPKYELLIDEITAEGNRLVVRARLKGRHEGVFGDIQPTFRNVEFNLVVGYEVENRKIISHWLIADQLALMEQLGA